MKKYEVSAKGAKWLRRSNILYFFLAWNAFSLCAYQWYTGRENNDTEWKKLSGTQKYLRMMTDPSDKVDVISVKGFNFKDAEKKTTTMGEITTKPESPK